MAKRKEVNQFREKDVSRLKLVAEREKSSPFDVKGISTKVTTSEMLEVLRTEREKRGHES